MARRQRGVFSKLPKSFGLAFFQKTLFGAKISPCKSQKEIEVHGSYLSNRNRMDGNSKIPRGKIATIKRQDRDIYDFTLTWAGLKKASGKSFVEWRVRSSFCLSPWGSPILIWESKYYEKDREISSIKGGYCHLLWQRSELHSKK